MSRNYSPAQHVADCPNNSGRMVASLDRKRLGQDTSGLEGKSTPGVFDEEASRKPLALAADAVSYGI